MSESVFWIHDDCMGSVPAIPAIYVFDERKLTEERWSLKRIGFLYECLLEMPVEIERGDPVERITCFAIDHKAARIVTVETPDPRLRAQQVALAKRFTLQVEVPEPFVVLAKTPDLRRFSKYWYNLPPEQR